MGGEEDPTNRGTRGRRTFVRLLTFLRPYRTSFVVSSLLAIASQVAVILGFVLTGVVIDELDFVPEKYMDDPDAEKRGIRDGLARLADDLDFKHLLVAHGTPITGQGRERLREFAGG